MESFDYLSVLLSVIIGLAITQVLLGFRRLILTRMKGLNGEFHVIFVLAAIVAAITRREWVHKLLTLAFALLFLLYISLLFARL